jgi:hypothetical protein
MTSHPVGGEGSRTAQPGNDTVAEGEPHMVAAADYPFLDVLWTMLVFFAWVIWFVMLFKVIGDVFRRHDIGGAAKVLWLIVVILLPFLGVFAYLIAQSRRMAERDAKEAESAQQQFDDYVKSVAANGGTAAEIDRAKQLLDRGAITPAEFDAIKTKALASA